LHRDATQSTTKEPTINTHPIFSTRACPPAAIKQQQFQAHNKQKVLEAFQQTYKLQKKKKELNENNKGA
jgi:hypothetical protein